MNDKSISSSLLDPSTGGTEADVSASLSVQKILQGARSVISRQGTRKLSMSDICEAAGVSRGTMYRYFKTKDEVLAAMSESISLSFERGVRDVALRESDLHKRLLAVLDFLFAYSKEYATDRAVEVEPTFVLGFFRGHFTRYVNALNDALATIYDAVEQDGSDIDRDLISQALIRMTLSMVLVPSDNTWDRFPDRMPDIFSVFLERRGLKLATT